MLTEKEYIIFADESDKKGPRFGNFYGGILVGASQYERITRQLKDAKAALNLHGEVKWSKVSEAYVTKYQALMDIAFEEIKADHMKMRVMFQKTASKRRDLTPEQHDNEFLLLYYQFLKHAFGFRWLTPHEGPVNLRFYLDNLPDTRERTKQFKSYLAALSTSYEWRRKKLQLLEENIVEVRSHDHPILEVADIILGSICFRLNMKHKEKDPITGKRGRRTKAKEVLYKYIHKKICEVRPRFNIGCSTSGFEVDHFLMPYRHWVFHSVEKK